MIVHPLCYIYLSCPSPCLCLYQHGHVTVAVALHLRAAVPALLKARNLFCLNDQNNIACFMIIRGVYHLIFQSFVYLLLIDIEILGDIIERLDDTHLL